MFHRGFKYEKTDESMRPQAECFYCFRVFETPMKHEARVFEITSPTKENCLNYHLNKVSQFNYYIYYMMCMILSPNCCTVTIVEYSSTDVTLLSVLSEHVASQSKWQSADLDFLKLAKKRKSVCSALFRGNVCIWSDKISNVSAILGRKSTARLKVNQNTR